MEQIRAPAVEGSFYPSEAAELKQLLEECFTTSPLGPLAARLPSPEMLGGMVPHAGFVYSGPCAAHFYSRLERNIQSIVLIGVNHRGRGVKAALSPADYWETPLGKIKVDQGINKLLQDRVGFLQKDEQAHDQEHSIEVQLPFLQTVLRRDMTFVPISLSHLSEEECAQLGQAIAAVCEAESASGKKTVVIASSDLSHYLSPKETEELDRLALEKVLGLDPTGLLKTVEEEAITMCGVVPTAVFLFAAKALGAAHTRLLKHCHSGDAVPMREVVGYASVAVEF